jgi:phosphate transport system protein
MARKGYQEELNQLQEDVIEMGRLVAERLQMGITALDKNDTELAKSVIFGDTDINDIYIELESKCVNLFALQQPVAGDLRLIASSFKIITDLERVGDLAVNLGDYTIDSRKDVFPDVDINSIGNAVLDMLYDSMDAYKNQNVDACFEIESRDSTIDSMCLEANEVVVKALIETQIGEGGSVDMLDNLMIEVQCFLLTIRDLERIGDHAANIAARTLYIVTNNDELLY